jgi:phenylacetate-CoA ligase
MPTYEELRQRHVRDAMARIGELIERIDWPAGKLAAHRQAELRRLLRTAQAASPWHRKRLVGLDPDSLDEHTLAELPVMTRVDLIANFDEIVTDDRLRLDVVEAHLQRLDQRDAYLLDRYYAVASGGSTGRRGVFVYDWDAWILAYYGITRRVTRQFPVTDPIEQTVAGLNDDQPTVLAGYPSALHPLTRQAQAGRLRIAPRYVISTSEPLLPEIRQALEQTWGVPVLNYYACSETGALAISCGQGPGPHPADDLAIVEPVDQLGRPVPAGVRAARSWSPTCSTTPCR